MDYPEVHSDLAVRRAKTFFKNKIPTSTRNTEAQIYKIMQSKPVNKKNLKKLERLIRIACPDVVKVRCGMHGKECFIMAQFIDTNYNTTITTLEVGTLEPVADIPHSAGNIVSLCFRTGSSYIHRGAFTWHALKRLFERFPQYRTMSDDDVAQYMSDWIYHVSFVVWGDVDTHSCFTKVMDGVEARCDLICRSNGKDVDPIPIIKTFVKEYK